MKQTLIATIIVVFLAMGTFMFFNSNQTQTGKVILEPINPEFEKIPVPSIEVPIGAEINKPIITDYDIKIINFAYFPIVLKIFEGETVSWENRDIQKHTITAEIGKELNSPSLEKGQYYSHTFSSVGTYEYYCKLHPYVKGKIIVKPRGV